MEYNSFNEAPKIFHFWSAVSTIAGALRRRVWFDMEYFKWTPNFYIIFVAPPGIATKSVSLGIGERLLCEIPGIKFGPNALTCQALPMALQAASEGVEIEGEIHQMSCLSFFSSELGVLLNPQDRQMVDVLVDFWDGKSGVWQKLTKSQGRDDVVNPWLNLIAATTPAWLADSLPKAMIDGGLMSRCIFVYADAKRQLVPYPKGTITKEARDLWPLLVQDLAVIATMGGEYRLSPEAYEYGVNWYTEHYNQMRERADLAGQFGGYMTRKQGHLHKLAMVLAASESNSLIIQRHHLEDAVQMLAVVEKGLPFVFSKMNTAPEQEVTLEILEYCRRRGRIRQTPLYQFFLSRIKYDDFTKAISGLAAAGHIKMTQVGNEIFIEAVSEAQSKVD